MTVSSALVAFPAPLSAAETATVARVLHAELAIPVGSRLTVLTVREPVPASVGVEDANVATDRDAVVVIADQEIAAVYEAVVAVDEGFVRSFRITASDPAAFGVGDSAT